MTAARTALVALALLATLALATLAACSGGSEATPTAAASSATASPEVTATPAPVLTVTATPELTTSDLGVPRGRIFYLCPNGWCAVDFDGTDYGPLAGIPRNANSLTPSPSGDLVAYYFNEGEARWLGVASPDGSNAQRLAEARSVHDPVPPVWSPDALTIYIERGPPPGTDGIGGDTDILAVDVATGVVTVLVDSDGYDGGPQVSPDGSMLVFTHSGAAGPVTSIRTVPTSGGAATDVRTGTQVITSPT